MQLTWNCTFEEYKQATRSIVFGLHAKRSALRSWIRAMLWFAAAVALACMVISYRGRQRGSVLAVTAEFIFQSEPMLPWLALGTLFVLNQFAARRTPGQSVAILTGFFISCLALLIGYEILMRHVAEQGIAGAISVRPAVITRGLSGYSSRELVPWIFVGIFWFNLVTQAARGGLWRKIWDESPRMQMSRNFEFDIHGIRFSDPLQAEEIRWEAFQSSADIGNLILLYSGLANAVIIPKRIFPDAQSLEAFKNVVAKFVRPAVRGFTIEPTEEANKGDSPGEAGGKAVVG